MVVLRAGTDMARADIATKVHTIRARTIRRMLAMGSRSMRRRAAEMGGSMRLQAQLVLLVVRC